MAQVKSLQTGIKFKDTPIGKVPVDWEVLSLSQVAEINMGQSPPSADYHDKEEGLPFYQGNADFGPKYPTASRWCKKPLKVAAQGDILISVRAPVGEINVAGHSCCIGRGIAAIRAINIDSDYLYQATLFHRKALEKVAQGSTFEAINRKDLSDFLILAPSTAEQKKIAEILTAVDDAIGKTDRIMEKTKELKKGLMQKLLTRGIGHKKFRMTEIGEIPVEWEVVELGDLAAKEKFAIVDGPFGSSINTSVDYIEHGIPVIRTVNIRPFEFIEDNLKYISEDKFAEISRSQVRPDDVLLSKVGTVGYACIFPNFIEKAILFTTGSCKITVDRTVITPAYLCYYLNYLKPHMDKIAAEGVQPFLNMTDIRRLRIAVPSLREQRGIIDNFSIVDSELQNENKTKGNLQSLKKSLMQVLLTGKVRVQLR